MKHVAVFRPPLKHIILGIGLRELLAPWTGHEYDFEIWVRLGYYMQNLGNPYRTLPYVPGLSFAPNTSIGSISYLPFSAFIFGLTYRFYLVLGEPSRFLYYFLLKQPMVLADVGVAIMLAKVILVSGNSSIARRAFFVWLYFPLGIIISAMWGQLDPLALFLSLLSIYYFLASKWLSSAIFLGLSIYLKTLPVIFLPVLLMQGQIVKRFRYSIVTLSIPVLGTLVPEQALGWGYRGLYNNTSYQVAIPSQGAMSILGQSLSLITLPANVDYLVGSVWLFTLLISYIYIYRKHLALFQGLVLATLAFSISRPFLPEQWSLYPLAFLLLQGREEMRHFIGLAVVATGFLITDNTLLVRFFTPISVNAYYWDIFVNNQSIYAGVRMVALIVLALAYFVESTLVLLGKESIILRLLQSARLSQFVQKRLSPLEVTLR